VTSGKRKVPTPHCSFCDGSVDDPEMRFLLAAPNDFPKRVYICDRCIEVAVGALPGNEKLRCICAYCPQHGKKGERVELLPKRRGKR